MKRFLPGILAGLLILGAATPAFAAEKIFVDPVQADGSEIAVTGRVVGLGGHEGPLNIRVNVAVTCVNGASFNAGLGASVTGFSGGTYDFTLESGGLGALLGCDEVATATVLSARAS